MIRVKSDDSCVPGNPNHLYIRIYISLDGAITEVDAVRRWFHEIYKFKQSINQSSSPTSSFQRPRSTTTFGSHNEYLYIDVDCNGNDIIYIYVYDAWEDEHKHTFQFQTVDSDDNENCRFGHVSNGTRLSLLLRKMYLHVL